MKKPVMTRIKIAGARAIYRLTGKLPDAGTWPGVWGDSRAFGPDRWTRRDAGFERREFDYDDAVQFLVGTRRGSARDIRDGSIPRTDLEFISRQMQELKPETPLRGLHIGNFVGLSLAYLTDAARRLHPDSVVVSIDPNIPHRGIDAPHDLVTGLMTRYSLEANWLPITGFTLARTAVRDVLNRRNGPTAFASYHGFSATFSLRNLRRLGLKFDFVLIDGNHNAGYLKREIDVLAELVRPGGLLFLDDVDEYWEGVVEVFKSLDDRRFKRAAHKGRVGVVRRTGPAAGRAGKGNRARAAGKPTGA